MRRLGLLAGFDGLVWLVALNLSLGGLLVAATMKYADNILKCFATAIAVRSQEKRREQHRAFRTLPTLPTPPILPILPTLPTYYGRYSPARSSQFRSSASN